MLIVARFIQGAGGGIFPLAFGIVRDEFPREKVAGGIGLLSAILGVGGGAGIVLSGVIVEHLSYHWLFWIPLVPVVVAAVATWRFVPESPVRVPGRMNWLAAALMTIGISAALLAISETTTWGWGSPKTLAAPARRLHFISAWIAGGGAQRPSAGGHDDDARAGRVDHQRLRLPAGGRAVCLVRRLPAVRPAADQHRVRLRRVGGGVGPVPAAHHGGDDDPRAQGRCDLRALRIARAPSWRARCSPPRRS